MPHYACIAIQEDDKIATFTVLTKVMAPFPMYGT